MSLSFELNQAKGYLSTVDRLMLETEEVRDKRRQNAQTSRCFVNQISEGRNLLDAGICVGQG